VHLRAPCGKYLLKDLHKELEARKAKHLYRSRRISDGPQQPEMVIDGKKVISFCSNDYLGLASHPKIKQAFIDGIKNRSGDWISDLGNGSADFMLGQTTGLDDAKRTLGDIAEEKIDQWCVEQEQAEAKRAAMFTVDVGDANHNGIMNHFVKTQLYSYIINKSGFRDNLQLDYALCLADYEAAEDNLLRALSSQYPNGSVPHGFRPINRLQYADKPAWTMLAIPGLVYSA